VRPEVGGVELLGFTFVFRGLLSPFAHPAFTAMTGIGVALRGHHRRGGWAVVLGLLGAMTLHGLWNGLATYGLPGIAAAYLLVACVLIALVAVVVAGPAPGGQADLAVPARLPAGRRGHRGRPADALDAARPPPGPAVGAPSPRGPAAAQR
jgi:hypothetical protein